jgi:hypothetical protein
MARTGMAYIIEELRGLTEAGTADYTVGTTAYWLDNTLQDILDLHRQDVRFQELQAYPAQEAGGSIAYYDHGSACDYLEETTGGSAITYLQDSTGATLGTSLWTANYRRGMFTFNSSTDGTVVYLTSRCYDINAAAADVWRRKAAHASAASFDFSTDNHSISRSQVYDHAMEMVRFFENMSGEGLGVVQRFRSDIE